jgi:hypothetical protein
MMATKFKVRWQVSDGYVGGARPQSFNIDIDEMVENCETETEALQYLDDAVHDDFDNTVSYSIHNEEDVIEAWRKACADKGKDSAS